VLTYKKVFVISSFNCENTKVMWSSRRTKLFGWQKLSHYWRAETNR